MGVALCALLVAGLPCSASAADSLPEQPAGRCLYDPTGAVDAASAAHLEEACESLDRSGAGQLEIAVVADLGGLDRDEYANELFAKWKIGHKGRDDGLLVLVKTGAPGARQLKIEVGYGLEGALPDGKVVAMARDLALPNLNLNRYGDGLVPLVDALIVETKKEAAAGNVERRIAQRQQEQDGNGTDLALGGMFLAVLLLWWLLFYLYRLVKHLPGKATRLFGGLLILMGVVSVFGQGSQHKILLLLAWGVCSLLGVWAYFWLSEHRCPKCGHWLNLSNTTSIEATTLVEGRAESNSACTHCDYREHLEAAIARKVVYSGRSGGGGGGNGGGGGGFSGGGGGSSGGGGGGFGF